jgi:hypothetical protein
MRSSTSLTAVLIVVLTACAGDAPTAVVAPREATRLAAPAGGAASATAERPWKGQCDVEATITGPTTFLISGTCQLAHLGRATVVTDETIDWATGSFTNTSTYTAANGDVLYTAGSGVAAFGANGAGNLTGTWTAAGGTGQFSGATGAAAYAESVQVTGPASALGRYVLDGSLSY